MNDYKQPVREALERGRQAKELYHGSFLHQQRSERLDWPQQMTNLGLLDATDRIIEALAQGENIRTDGSIQFMFERKNLTSDQATIQISNDYEKKVAQLREKIFGRNEEAYQHCSIGFHTNLLNGSIQAEFTRPDFNYNTLIPIVVNLALGVWEWADRGIPLLSGAALIATVPYTAFHGVRHLRSDSKKSLRVIVKPASDMYRPDQLETLQTVYKELSEIAPQQKI